MRGALWGRCLDQITQGRDSGKESGLTTGWLDVNEQSHQSLRRLDPRFGGSLVGNLSTSTQAQIPKNQQDEKAASISSHVQWGLWRSHTCSQGWACCVEGPERASCQSSHSGQVCAQTALSDGTKRMSHQWAKQDAPVHVAVVYSRWTGMMQHLPPGGWRGPARSYC